MIDRQKSTDLSVHSSTRGLDLTIRWNDFGARSFNRRKPGPLSQVKLQWLGVCWRKPFWSTGVLECWKKPKAEICLELVPSLLHYSITPVFEAPFGGRPRLGAQGPDSLHGRGSATFKGYGLCERDSTLLMS